MARYCRFFRGLRGSPSREVATLVNLVARDIRTCTGNNIRMIGEQSGKCPWVDSLTSIRSGIKEAELVKVQEQDSWRFGLLGFTAGSKARVGLFGCRKGEKGGAGLSR